MNTTSSDEPWWRDSPSTGWFDCRIAIAAVAIATLGRLALDSALGDNYPFITYFGAVAAVAWYGKTRPSVLTLVASGILARYLFLPPRYSFLITDPGEVIGLALFFANGVVTVGMGHALRMARMKTGNLLADALVRAEEIRQTAIAEVEQRERLRTTLDSIGDAVIITDRAGRVISLNPVAEVLTGWTTREAVGVLLTEVFHIVNEESRQPIENPAMEAIQAGVTVGWATHTLLIGKDGKERPIDDSAAPIRGQDGVIVGCVLVFRDVSERKVQQQAVSSSEARLRRVFESNVVGMIQWDLDRSLILDANDTFLRMTGYTHKDVIAGRLNFREMTPPEWTSRNEAGICAIRTDGHAAPYEKEYFRKDGSRVPVIIAGTRFEDSPSEGMSLLIDISDRIQAEREIARIAAESERQRRLYETVLSNTPDFVYVFSLDHKVLYANEALITMWGRGRDGAIGKTFLEIGYEPWHAEMHDREIDQVRATRLPIRGEVPFTGTKGRRQYDYIFVPVIGADGEVEAVAGTTRDVTDRVETERRLRESEERSAFVRRSSGVGFWYCDLPFDVLEWDELVKSHFHLPPDATVTIQTFYDRLHPDDREPTRQAIERSIAGRSPYQVVYRTVNPQTGAVTWVRAIGRTFYAEDGTPTRFDGVTLDVSDQKRAEEQQAYLFELSDTIRPLSDPADVQAAASRVLGERLGANRVIYFEICGDEYVIDRDYAAGVLPLSGRYPVAAFGPALLANLLDGRTVIEADATAEPDRPLSERAAFASIQVRGHVDVPLVKDGRFVAGMTVHVCDRRDWTRQEVALIEDTAERTWAAVERVRAEEEIARLAAAAERERRLFAAVLSNSRNSGARRDHQLRDGRRLRALDGIDTRPRPGPLHRCSRVRGPRCQYCGGRYRYRQSGRDVAGRPDVCPATGDSLLP